MTWYCQVCKVQNGPRLEECRQCGQHWETVWAPPRKKSRSKSRTYVKEKQADDQTEGQWEVFPKGAPWITTTPSRSTAYRTEAMQVTAEKGAAPLGPKVQPLQQPPTAEVSDLQMTIEESKKLEHLRGLQEMGVELPEHLATELEALHQKEEKVASAKTLSHGHLNKLRKLKAQVGAAAKKITDLDSEWAKFMTATTEKIKEHARMYQMCRSDMLENYNEKLQELYVIKQEVGRASQSLIAQPAEPEVAPQDLPVLDEQLQQMQEMMHQVSQVGGTIDLTDDLDMEQDEEGSADNVPVGGSVKKGSPKVKLFRAATSPSKVAQQHLKPDIQAVREAKAKEKGEK
eukprot:s549_g3.t1